MGSAGSLPSEATQAPPPRPSALVQEDELLSSNHLPELHNDVSETKPLIPRDPWQFCVRSWLWLICHNIRVCFIYFLLKHMMWTLTFTTCWRSSNWIKFKWSKASSFCWNRKCCKETVGRWNNELLCWPLTLWLFKYSREKNNCLKIPITKFSIL